MIVEYRGAAGYGIDGAIRDGASFAASDFPCFARSAIHRVLLDDEKVAGVSSSAK